MSYVGVPVVRRTIRSAASLVIVVSLLFGIQAIATADIFPENSYPEFVEVGDLDSAIPTPSSVLGHRIGARPVWHRDVLDYCEALAASSPRVQLRSYGESHEGRELLLLVISSEENMARLDEVQRSLVLLADPRELSSGEADALIETTPLCAWMAYTIHGDELSGTDASLGLAYQLVAGRGEVMESIRENAIVIIDPLQNPDGRDRFISQLYSFNGQVPNPDTQSMGHSGSWPWGRGNHYFFDLNRDWFTLVHPESRGRVAEVAAWRPQLMIDGHEMGSFSTFLFSPPRAPFNPFMGEAIHKWWSRFAADQAESFDAHGWSYYTREWNEEFFPGYGSSWSIYSGAIGILYEQAGTEGTIVKRPDGTELDYGEATHHQLVSSIANLKTAADHSEELLHDYRRFRSEAVASGKNGVVKEYLFPLGEDPDRTHRLVETLVQQGIEVDIATTKISARSLHDAWGENANAKEFPAGTYRVSLEQPDARLIRVILDFHIQMPDSFLVEEREYLERQKGSRLYEATSWSMALAYGIPVYWSGETSRGTFDRVTEVEFTSGSFENANSNYGFVIDGRSDAAIRAAGRLASEGYVVRVALESFSVDGHHYPRGSFVLRVDANPADLGDHLAVLSDELAISVRGVSTALASSGPDLGGGRFGAMVEPKIAILAGDGISFTSSGSLIYLFDQELEMRASILDVSTLRYADLSKYNVILLPSAWGGASGYRRILEDSGTGKLRSWVEAGGTLIGTGSGASFLADSTSGLSETRLRRQVLEEYPYPIWGLDLEDAENVGLFQSTGVPLAEETEDGIAQAPAKETRSPGAASGADLIGASAYRIPGEGSPVLGPGAAPFLGREAARILGKANSSKFWEPPAATSAELTKDERAIVDGRFRRFQPQGAFVRADLDQEHWLTGGMPEKIPAFLSGSYAYVAKDPVRTVARLARPEELHIGGLLWPEAVARSALTAIATRESKGRGQVILIGIEPFFRGYMHSSKRLLLNAALLGPGLGATQTVPW